MSLRTETYADLKALGEAHYGSTMTGTDETRFKALINRAARHAFEECNYWPRFLVVGEPRTLARGYVSMSEDSFYVYGAGTSDVNGLYKRNKTQNGKPAYTKYDTDGTKALYSLWWDDDLVVDAWVIREGARGADPGGDSHYLIGSTDDTPPLSGWDNDLGDDPSPLLVDVADIDTVLRVHRSQPYKNNSVLEFNQAVDSIGSRMMSTQNITDDDGVVWVTYKKVLADTYGDGTGGSVADIPHEWFDFMAMYASRHMQIAQRQGNASPFAVIASREVDNALLEQLDKIDKQHIFQTIGKRVQTHLTHNTQL